VVLLALAAGTGAAVLVAGVAFGFSYSCSSNGVCSGMKTDSFARADVCVAGTTSYFENSYLPADAISPSLTNFMVGPPNPPCSGATVSGATPEPFPASSTNPDGTKATPGRGEATYRFDWTVTVPPGSTPTGDMNVSWTIDFTLPPGSTSPTSSTETTGTTMPTTTTPMPKPVPCHCLSSPFGNPILKLDPTILNKKHVPPDKHNFGMGMDWFLFCSKGTGACKGYVWINPAAKLLTGKDKPSHDTLRLALTQNLITCLGFCDATNQGGFQITMRSPDQLNKLYGRTLAFEVWTWCPGGTIERYTVNVFVDHHGVVRKPKHGRRLISGQQEHACSPQAEPPRKIRKRICG
jgi:hypothetical protein